MLVAVASDFFQGLRLLGEDAPADLVSRLQLGHRQADLLHGFLPAALDEALAQALQLVLCLLLLSGRQKHLGLDEHQVGCHGDELAGDLHIQPLHFVQVGQILLQDGGDGHILNFDLILAQQQKNHIQGPLKVLHGFAAGVDNALQVILGFRHRQFLFFRTGKLLRPNTLTHILGIIPPFFHRRKRVEK